jgi:hypothetical protein
LKNLKVDESAFAEKPAKNVENTNENNKHTSSKQKKNKKGQDFMEYAKNNGIDLKIQYDEGEKQDKTYQNRKYDANYQANQGTYQNNKNFHKEKFHSGSQNTNTEENNTQRPSENNYYKEKKNFGSYQNNYNKKPFNPNYAKNFHTVNKFDSFNAPQYQNAQNIQTGYYPQQVNNATITPQPNQSYRKFNQKEENQNFEQDMSSFILNSLDFYFSEKNLNNNHYMRTKIDSEGFLDVNDLVNFNKMKQNGVTVDLVKQTIQMSTVSSNIEVSMGSEGELKFKSKNWEEIRDNLTPLEVLEEKRNLKKMNNYNNPNPYYNNFKYVGMQNNYYYQMNPLQYDPNMINQQMMAGYGMGMNQGNPLQYSQFPGYDMNMMMNYNMYQGAMAGNQGNNNSENQNN